MPDHFHVLITVTAEMTAEQAVQLIKGGFAFRAGRELGFRAPVWQKGFSEITPPQRLKAPPEGTAFGTAKAMP
jgi:REP element-mobilizing transposase RayT